MSLADSIFNKVISSVRVKVEHVISGIKRCRIVKDTLRLTSLGCSDSVMEIACGLHNLRVLFRNSFPLFDLFDFFGSSVIPVEATRYSVAKKKQKSDNH
ncbi:MAG: hypothetical protein JNM06_12070 [Blastocatellia bacterium]|nr:hypothetical protein [Blastocatellia bacterium]